MLAYVSDTHVNYVNIGDSAYNAKLYSGWGKMPMEMVCVTISSSSGSARERSVVPRSFFSGDTMSP